MNQDIRKLKMILLKKKLLKLENKFQLSSCIVFSDSTSSLIIDTKEISAGTE